MTTLNIQETPPRGGELSRGREYVTHSPLTKLVVRVRLPDAALTSSTRAKILSGSVQYGAISIRRVTAVGGRGCE